MNRIDDITLIAYIDGELDPKSCAELEAVLVRDASLCEKIRELRESTALVRTVFNDALYGASVDGTIASVTTASPTHLRSFVPRRMSLPLAASLAALMLGGLGGYYLNPASQQTMTGVRSIGVSDDAERRYAFELGLDKELSGATVVWNNPGTGNHGTVTPVRTFQTESGQYCREFEETRVVAGERQSEGGIACRRDDGLWQVRLRFYPE